MLAAAIICCMFIAPAFLVNSDCRSMWLTLLVICSAAVLTAKVAASTHCRALVLRHRFLPTLSASSISPYAAADWTFAADDCFWLLVVTSLPHGKLLFAQFSCVTATGCDAAARHGQLLATLLSHSPSSQLSSYRSFVTATVVTGTIVAAAVTAAAITAIVITSAAVTAVVIPIIVTAR